MLQTARSSRPTLIVAVAICIVSALFFLRRAHGALVHADGMYFFDLRPMYCAGVALRAHADPYLSEPLSSCQLAIGAIRGLTPLPAPLPPYALEPFVAVSHLSFPAVGMLYAVFAIGAFALCTYWTASLARVAWWFAALALFWVAFWNEANLGQLSIFALTAIVGTAYLAKRGQYVAAGALSAVASIQPTLALPLLVVLAIAIPKARLGLAIGFGIVALLALAAGPALDASYFRAELPVHARSEVYSPFQFSATWLAAALGAAPELALRVGSLSYVVSFACAIAAGIALMRRGETTLGILLPVAIVTIGGSFIHISQVATVLPVGLILASRAKRGRTFVSVATGVLGVEWISAWSESATKIVAVTLLKIVTQTLVLAALVRRDGAPLARALVPCAAFAVACLVATFAAAHAPLAIPTLTAAQTHAIASAGPLLSDRWRVFLDATYEGRTVARITALKALPWLAAVAIVLYGAVATVDASLLRAESETDARA